MEIFGSSSSDRVVDGFANKSSRSDDSRDFGRKEVHSIAEEDPSHELGVDRNAQHENSSSSEKDCETCSDRDAVDAPARSTNEQKSMDVLVGDSE